MAKDYKSDFHLINNKLENLVQDIAIFQMGINNKTNITSTRINSDINHLQEQKYGIQNSKIEEIYRNDNINTHVKTNISEAEQHIDKAIVKQNSNHAIFNQPDNNKYADVLTQRIREALNSNNVNILFQPIVRLPHSKMRFSDCFFSLKV